MRIFILVTHLLGIGHFARMAALARGLVAAGHGVTLVSGGRRVSTIPVEGVRLVQLPTLHCQGTDFHTFYRDDGTVAGADVLEQRIREIEAAYYSAQPDVLITELYPFGRRALAAEFQAVLALAEAASPRPAILSSIRDVLNPPSKPDRAAAVLTTLAAHYDGILLHGEAGIIPLEVSWPLTPPLARRLTYTGYLHDGARGIDAQGTDGMGEILVSGGGSDAGAIINGTACAAARLMPEARWRILIGHGVKEADFAALIADAPANTIIERARPDFPALLGRAVLSISQAGYNTVVDLAAAKPRAILIPFSDGGEREQTIRAQALAARGLAQLLPAESLTPHALADAVRGALTQPAPDWAGFTLDGASRAVTAISDHHAEAHARHAAWQRLDAALAEARARGITLPFWLRDDDAVEPTAALDDLLTLTGRWDIPLALAVIPAFATGELAARLADEPRVRVLVHGSAHTNHAPAGEKSAEFGAHRPVAVMRDELAEGLVKLSTLFGATLLPVFVPPWNRIAPEIAAMLPELGYSGLSTFAARREGGRIRHVNTHWDLLYPRTRSKAEAIHQLAAQVEGALTQPSPVPIGLLTHHLAQDGWDNRLLEAVLTCVMESGAVRFLGLEEIFNDN